MSRLINTAPMVEQVVAKMVHTIISIGFLDPTAIRRLMTNAGKRVILDVFKASRVHMALLAVSWLALSRFSSCMALIPRGVAALPIPKIDAPKLSMIAPEAGW